MRSLPVARDAAGTGARATPDFDRTGSSYEVNVGASWEIDVFGGLRRGRDAARAEYAASEAGAVATRLAVAAHTADVHITIPGCSASRSPSAQTRRAAARAGQASVRKGIAAELQVNQAEGALARSRRRSRSSKPGSSGDERAGRAARRAAGNAPRRTEPADAGSRLVWPRPARRPR